MSTSAAIASPSRPHPLSIATPALRPPSASLPLFSPVNEAGIFEFDRVLKSGELSKRRKRTNVRLDCHLPCRYDRLWCHCCEPLQALIGITSVGGPFKSSFTSRFYQECATELTATTDMGHGPSCTTTQRPFYLQRPSRDPTQTSDQAFRSIGGSGPKRP